jgi:hypothetical protein
VEHLKELNSNVLASLQALASNLTYGGSGKALTNTQMFLLAGLHDFGLTDIWLNQFLVELVGKTVNLLASLF